MPHRQRVGDPALGRLAGGAGGEGQAAGAGFGDRWAAGRPERQQSFHQHAAGGMIHVGVSVGPGGSHPELATAELPDFVLGLGGQIGEGTRVAECALQPIFEHVCDSTVWMLIRLGERAASSLVWWESSGLSTWPEPRSHRIRTLAIPVLSCCWNLPYTRSACTRIRSGHRPLRGARGQASRERIHRVPASRPVGTRCPDARPGTRDLLAHEGNGVGARHKPISRELALEPHGDRGPVPPVGQVQQGIPLGRLQGSGSLSIAILAAIASTSTGPSVSTSTNRPTPSGATCRPHSSASVR